LRLWEACVERRLWEVCGESGMHNLQGDCDFLTLLLTSPLPVLVVMLLCKCQLCDCFA